MSDGINDGLRHLPIPGLVLYYEDKAKTENVFAARRDASFYRNPGRGFRYHIIAKNGVSSVCGIPILDIDYKMLAPNVDPILRCNRPGCKKHWKLFFQMCLSGK